MNFIINMKTNVLLSAEHFMSVTSVFPLPTISVTCYIDMLDGQATTMLEQKYQIQIEVEVETEMVTERQRDKDRGISVRHPLGARVCIHHRSIAAVLPQAVICKIPSLLHAETGFSPCFLWHLRQHSTLPGACGHDGLWETVALSLVIYY